MNTFKTSAELKAIAKENLLGQYTTTIGATLLILAITMLLNSIVTFVVNPTNLITLIIYEIAIFIIELLMGVFASGKAYLYLNIVYSQPSTVGDIFYSFSTHPDKAVGIQFVFSLFSLIVNLPITIYLNFYAGLGYSEIGNLLVIISCVGIIAYIYAVLTWSQAFYILQDFPDRSVKDILATSARLMKGNRFRLFYISVSFIPLMLLCMVTMFIPFLWLNSYIEATMAAFYQDLIAVTSANMAQENNT